MNKVININTTENYRLIAISDVHGHYHLLKKMLNKLCLNNNDYLVIIGDFINRGGDSYLTYKYIKELLKRDKTIVLKGNHEHNLHNYLMDKQKINRMYQFLLRDKKEHIITTVLKNNNRDIFSFKNCEHFYDYIQTNMLPIIKFVEELPILLNFNEFRFTHGGYDELFCLPKDELKFLKYDFYNDFSQINDKKTIVGHWPSCNNRFNDLINRPYINEDKNIVFIDGGAGVKISGELNAYIINSSNGKVSFNDVQVNDFQEKDIISEHHFTFKNEILYVDYPEQDIEVLTREDMYSYCKHLTSGKNFWTFSSLIIESDNGAKLRTNYVNRFFNLRKGDKVKVCKTFNDATLVKYNGEFGWILSNQI